MGKDPESEKSSEILGVLSLRRAHGYGQEKKGQKGSLSCTGGGLNAAQQNFI